MDKKKLETLKRTVSGIVKKTPVTDIHTHLFSPGFGKLCLWGIDELLAYHYLVAEAFHWIKMSYSKFWILSRKEQANIIWKTLFVDNTPYSTSTWGVIDVLNRLGIDTKKKDLEAIRNQFRLKESMAHIEEVFKLSGVKDVVMTNDPFDDNERKCWEEGVKMDPRFHCALRLDVMLTRWPDCVKTLKKLGYKMTEELGKETIKELSRFLSDWISKTDSLYLAASLPPDFAFPEDSLRGRIIKECVLPVAEAHQIPFALMIGVKRRVNPGLTKAGDIAGKSDIAVVEHLCREYPNNRFMVTMLSLENQHELAVLARKFRNLMLFGCWWYLNIPSAIRTITETRLELLGSGFIAQNSDCRLIDQLIYKWDISRQIISDLLVEKYSGLASVGWAANKAEIQRDVTKLFSGNFWDFIGRTDKGSKS